MTVLPRVLAAVSALALGLGGALVVAAPATAAVDSFDVDNSSGDVAVANSLPWAVAQAELDPDHTDITILPAAGATVTLLTNLVITTDVTITGPGASAFTVVGSTATPGDSVFLISGAGPVEISGMTIAPSAAGTVHGIESYADSLIIDDLVLDGFSDDNFRIDAGVLDANNIVTRNSNNDGLSYVDFTGGVSTVRNVTASGNGDYGILLLMVGGTLDVSDVASSNNGGGVYLLDFGSVTSITRASVTDNDTEGVRVVGTTATATLTDVTASGNGVGCGCGGPGIVTIVDTDSVVQITRAVVTGNTADVGAGIYLQSVSSGSTVAINDSTVSGNHAVNGGGGLGGGIAIDGLYDAGSSASITDTTISGNDAEDAGGGIYLSDLGVGLPTGPVTVTRTTIDDNTAAYGAGLLLDGSSGTTGGGPALTLQDSTVSNNTAAEEGGGLYLYQDAANSPATVLLTGTTVSGNSAQGTTSSGNGGAVYVESAGPGPELAVRIEYSTIADNDPPGVGGVFVDGIGVDLTLLSSILAGNERGDLSFPAGIFGFTASWSLVQDASLAGFPLPATNLTGVDPELGPLANNGGSTKTHLITPGSPAYNAGDPAFVGAGLFDQRGQARVFERVDIGAVEWHPALAHTGVELTPGPPLVAFLLLFSGLAMVAFSRLRTARAVA